MGFSAAGYYPGTRIGMLKWQGWEIEWFGGFGWLGSERWKSFPKYLQFMMTHLYIQLSQWSYHVWEAFLVTLVLKVLPNHGPDLEHFGYTDSLACPNQLSHSNFLCTSDSSFSHLTILGKSTTKHPTFWEILPRNAAVVEHFPSMQQCLGKAMREDFCDVWRSWELRCSCDEEKPTTLPKRRQVKFWRMYLRLKALAICRKHFGFGSKGWLKLVGSPTFSKRCLENDRTWEGGHAVYP